LRPQRLLCPLLRRHLEGAANNDSVKERILALVVEKTGYPEEMLDLELDLEADLGVDTVKQAELFAAIRGTYNIPRDENLKLRDYPTLAHVIRFVYEKRPDLAGGTASAPKAEQPAAPVAPAAPVEGVSTCCHYEYAAPSLLLRQVAVATTDNSVKDRVLALVVEKTGYPSDMLDLDLDLEADLGVDTVKQAEMFAAIREAYNIPRDENRKLRDYPTIGHVIRFVYEMRPDLAGGNAQQPAIPKAPEAVSSPASIPVPTSTPASSHQHCRDRRGDPAKSLGHCCREDWLSQGDAGSRSRPGSRSRNRHRETGRDVCLGARGVQHTSR
jgi:acyl carrier protein